MTTIVYIILQENVKKPFFGLVIIPGGYLVYPGLTLLCMLAQLWQSLLLTKTKLVKDRYGSLLSPNFLRAPRKRSLKTKSLGPCSCLEYPCVFTGPNQSFNLQMISEYSYFNEINCCQKKKTEKLLGFSHRVSFLGVL